jgi:hypothetical protein
VLARASEMRVLPFGVRNAHALARTELDAVLDTCRAGYWVRHMAAVLPRYVNNVHARLVSCSWGLVLDACVEQGHHARPVLMFISQRPEERVRTAESCRDSENSRAALRVRLIVRLIPAPRSLYWARTEFLVQYTMNAGLQGW